MRTVLIQVSLLNIKMSGHETKKYYNTVFVHVLHGVGCGG